MAADPSHQSELVVQMVQEGLGLAQALSLPGSILQVPNHLHLLLPLVVYQRRKVEGWQGARSLGGHRIGRQPVAQGGTMIF